MNDHDIHELLQSSDRPRQIHADEYERIRDRLESVHADPAAGYDFAPVDGPERTIDPSNLSPRRSGLIVGGLAAVAASVLIALFLGGGPPTESLETGPSAEAEQSVDPLVELCRNEVAALVAGLREWGNLDNWLLTAGDVAGTNVDQLLSDALGGLAQLDPTNEAIATSKSDLERILAEEDDTIIFSTPYQNRLEDAVRSGAGELVSALDAIGGCQADHLEGLIARN